MKFSAFQVSATVMSEFDEIRNDNNNYCAVGEPGKADEQTKSDSLNCSDIITTILLSCYQTTQKKKKEIVYDTIIKHIILDEKKVNVASVFQTVSKNLSDILTNKYQQELEELQRYSTDVSKAKLLLATFEAQKRVFHTMLRQLANKVCSVVRAIEESRHYHNNNDDHIPTQRGADHLVEVRQRWLEKEWDERPCCPGP